jgi:hypothetical protein
VALRGPFTDLGVDPSTKPHPGTVAHAHTQPLCFFRQQHAWDLLLLSPNLTWPRCKATHRAAQRVFQPFRLPRSSGRQGTTRRRRRRRRRVGASVWDAYALDLPWEDIAEMHRTLLWLVHTVSSAPEGKMCCGFSCAEKSEDMRVEGKGEQSKSGSFLP